MMDLRALEIELMDRRKSLGCSHMGVAETLNIMGLTHHHMTNDQMEALRCHREALQILVMQRRGNVPDYYRALTQCDIGNIHWKMGNYLEAGIAYTEAMYFFEQSNTEKSNPGLQLTAKRMTMLGIESMTPEKTKWNLDDGEPLIRSPKKKTQNNVPASCISRYLVTLGVEPKGTPYPQDIKVAYTDLLVNLSPQPCPNNMNSGFQIVA